MAVRFSGAFPFVHVSAGPDPDATRLYYGKSFMYPLAAAPFVLVAGTSGFLLFHALLLALLVFGAYLFVAARSPEGPAVVLAAGYFFASVSPGYLVWTTPELFNLATVTLGYLCWLYKEVAPETLPRGLRWLRTGASDAVAIVLLAMATFSKPTNVLLVLPLLGVLAVRRRWRRAIAAAALFGLLVGGLFGANLAVTGDWNFQGGARSTYYAAFPFQTPTMGYDVGMSRATNEVLTNIIFDPQVFWSRLGWNLVYFVVGRHSGMLPYFFPGLFALVLFLRPWSPRAGWQWAVLAVAVAEILVVLVWIPHNYFGGGGVLGNRYFMNTYGLFLFLLPPVASGAAAVVPWAIGALFTAPIVLNSFYASFNPAEAAKSGPLRLLPVEMTLVNDLPINTRLDRVRVLFGSGPRFQIYFLDDNAYPREGERFWVRGDSRADLILKTADAARRLTLTLTGGRAATTVTVHVAEQTASASLAAGETKTLDIPLSHGFPYEGTRAWYATIRVHGGFVPMFVNPENGDARYLGVLVQPELTP